MEEGKGAREESWKRAPARRGRVDNVGERLVVGRKVRVRKPEYYETKLWRVGGVACGGLWRKLPVGLTGKGN